MLAQLPRDNQHWLQRLLWLPPDRNFFPRKRSRNSQPDMTLSCPSGPGTSRCVGRTRPGGACGCCVLSVCECSGKHRLQRPFLLSTPSHRWQNRDLWRSRGWFLAPPGEGRSGGSSCGDSGALEHSSGTAGGPLPIWEHYPKLLTPGAALM